MGGSTVIIEEKTSSTLSCRQYMSCLVKSPKTRFCKKQTDKYRALSTRCKLSDGYNISDSNALCYLLVLIQISTSVLPTLTAVTSMRCVAIRLDRTHARVKQHSQAMEKHAPVSCCGNFQNDLNVILCPSISYIRSVH